MRGLSDLYIYIMYETGSESPMWRKCSCILFVLWIAFVEMSFSQSCDKECQPGTFDLDLENLDLQQCDVCNHTELSPYAVWSSYGNCLQTCRDGYSEIANSVSTKDSISCFPIVNHQDFLSGRNSYTADEWPPGMRPVGSCTVPSSTGIRCNVACPLTTMTCSQDERLVPCVRPWKPFCAPCDNVLPPNAYRVSTAVAGAKWVQNFENTLLKSVYWVYNDKAAFANSIDSYGAKSDLVQIIASKGALNSQIWLSNVRHMRPSVDRTLPGNAVARFYVSKSRSRARSRSVTQIEGRRGFDNINISVSNTWVQVVIPIDMDGINIIGDAVNIDEISIINSLVTPYAGTHPLWCAVGRYKENGVCVSCQVGNACVGTSGIPAVVPCPLGSKSLPGSNTCICKPSFKTAFNSTSNIYSCVRCKVEGSSKLEYGNSEDCSRGYAAGTLVAWQRTPQSAPSKLKQLSCGPHSCCAVDQVGDVLCWGDNTNKRLGSDLLEKPWIFARDAFPVKNLGTPAVAVAVSQQETMGSKNDLSCALLEDGIVTCWGSFQCCPMTDQTCTTSEYYEIHECTPPGTDSQDEMCGFNDTQKAAVSLRVSSGTACATTHDGEIWCWGRDVCSSTQNGASPQKAQRWDTTQLGAVLNPPSQQKRRSRTTGLWPAGSYATKELTDFVLGESFICGRYKCSQCVSPSTLSGPWDEERDSLNKGIMICSGRLSDHKGEWKRNVDMDMGVLETIVPYYGVGTLMTAAGNSFIHTTIEGSSATSTVSRKIKMNSGVSWPPNAASTEMTEWNQEMKDVREISLLEVSAASTASNFACYKQLTPVEEVHCYVRRFDSTLNPKNMYMTSSAWQGSSALVLFVVEALQDATVLALGQNHACAGLKNGSVSCWGNWENGRLGKTTCEKAGHKVPVLVDGLTLLSLEEKARWTLSGGAQAIDFIWKIPMGGSISHALALLQMTPGRYMTETPSQHWVHVILTTRCISQSMNCKLILAKNLNLGASFLTSDLVFHVEDIVPGHIAHISSVVWADVGDQISVFSYNHPDQEEEIYLEVMSVAAYEDADSCAYNCPEGSDMRTITRYFRKEAHLARVLVNMALLTKLR